LPADEPWVGGRIKGVAATLAGCLLATGRISLKGELTALTEQAVTIGSAHHLRQWVGSVFKDFLGKDPEESGETVTTAKVERVATRQEGRDIASPSRSAAPVGDGEVKFGRRAEDSIVGAKILKG
jgi:two-component system, chemotaxis family, sensor kinase CheA